MGIRRRRRGVRLNLLSASLLEQESAPRNATPLRFQDSGKYAWIPAYAAVRRSIIAVPIFRSGFAVPPQSYAPRSIVVEFLSVNRYRPLLPATVVAVSMLLSGGVGFLLGASEQLQTPITEFPASFSTSNSSAQLNTSGINVVPAKFSQGPRVGTSREIGRLRAEVIRLRTLFARLAEVAEISDGEFDVDLDIEKSGFFEPLLPNDKTSMNGATADQLNFLDQALYRLSANTASLGRLFEERRLSFEQRLSGRPVSVGRISSRFGYRNDPITGDSILHRGVDFTGETGTPILALADGVVVFAGKNGAYGNLVELEHVNGYRSRYAHNQSLSVSKGSRVRKGEQIATLGSTGRSTGPHVHVEVHLKGQHVDPMLFVR